jgi:hypothetical protein
MPRPSKNCGRLGKLEITPDEDGVGSTMMTFKEFLKSQETRLKAEAEAHVRLKKQWEEALSALMSQIKEWVTESDPDKLLHISEGITTHYDDRIDQETLPRLDILMGSRGVSILPIAQQNVIGPRLKPTEGEWLGRVDMIGHPYSFELWLLINKKSEHCWYIRNDRDYSIRPLAKESFDKAMVELLS